MHLPRDLDRVSEVQLSDKSGSRFSLVENNKKQYAYEVKRNLIGVFTFLNTIETLWGYYQSGKFLLIHFLLIKSLKKNLTFLTSFYLRALFAGGKCPYFDIY